MSAPVPRGVPAFFASPLELEAAPALIFFARFGFIFFSNFWFLPVVRTTFAPSFFSPESHFGDLHFAQHRGNPFSGNQTCPHLSHLHASALICICTFGCYLWYLCCLLLLVTLPTVKVKHSPPALSPRTSGSTAASSPC